MKSFLKRMERDDIKERRTMLTIDPNHEIDPGIHSVILARHARRLQELCANATLTGDQIDEIERLTKDCVRAAARITVWADSKRK